MSINADLWISAAGLIFNALAYYFLEGISGSARFFPVCTIAFLTLAFLALMLRSLRNGAKTSLSVDFPSAALVLLSFLYLWGMTRWGYVLSTIYFMVLAMTILGYRRYHWILLVSPGVALGLYLLFSRVLSVPLPALSPGGWF